MPGTLVARGWLAGALLCALAAGSGCEDPAPGPAADAGGAGAGAELGQVELGKGEQVYAPLARDEALPYAAGTQGGHHVYVGFRMRGLDPSRVLVKVRTSVVGHPELDLDRSGRVNFTPETVAGDPDAGDPPEPTGDHLYVGWPAQILAAPMHEGEQAEITVALEDRLGRTASAMQRIVIGTLE